MKRYVTQDGAVFYVSRDPSGAPIDDVYEYPWHVGDFDLVDAQLARVWFLERVSFHDEFIFI